MALQFNDLISLIRTVSRADASAPVAYSFQGTNYSYQDLNETLRKELNEFVGDYRHFREHRYEVYSLIERAIDDVLPKKVQENYQMFAEIQTVPQGDRVLFRRKLSGARTRAKQFVTRVGLAGVYEVWKLGGEESFEVPTSAIGTAVQIPLEEFLDGRVDWAEMLAIVMEGMDELIYHEIGAALRASINQLPINNVVVSNDFDEVEFDRLLYIADAYGPSTIYCTMEFAAKMIPHDTWRYTEAMKAELWQNGRLANYKGRNVVIMPNGLEDETNSRKTVDASWCWIMPGGNAKPVKVVFEGDTLTREEQNHDWSRDIHIYKKVGVAAMMTNDICVYRDTSLGDMDIQSLNYNVGIEAVHTDVNVVDNSIEEETEGEGGTTVSPTPTPTVGG